MSRTIGPKEAQLRAMREARAAALPKATAPKPKKKPKGKAKP